METKTYDISIQEVTDNYKQRFDFSVKTPLSATGVTSIVEAVTKAMITPEPIN